VSRKKGFFARVWRFLTDGDTPRRTRAIDTLAQELRERLSENSVVATGSFERQLYSRDLAKVPKIIEKLLFRTTPIIVVHVGHEKDVMAAMRFAEERKIPVTPRGVSSSAFGGTVPTRNGIVLDLSPMSEILEIDPLRLTARVQPGTRWADLASRLADFGLSAVSTPSSRFSTVAGWISTGGLGIESFKYGHVRESVASARVILPGGGRVELGRGDERFHYLFGTEGQFGIITELVIRLRPKSDYSRARLFYFDDPSTALGFLNQVIKKDSRPSHLVFYDRVRLAEENLLLRDRGSIAEPLFKEREAVLIHFDDPENEKTFRETIERTYADCLSGGPAADYLWSERYFPLKAQRLGPNLLASEVLLERPALPKFIRRGRCLARRFGVNLGFEVIFASPDKGIAIASFRCDSRRFASYVLYLLLVQMVVHLATRLGGCPYGIGIWNTPFVRNRYSARAMGDMRRLKRKIDPNWILNPQKFFKLRARFSNILGLIFNPLIYRAILTVLGALSPLLGLRAKLLKPESEERRPAPAQKGEKAKIPLAEAPLRCAFCGACVSVCPAYLLTHDELVTGRSKLRLAEAIESRKELSPLEAARAFQCLRCNLCEEVCQTRLPLVDCYAALEAQLEKRLGRPVETIARFVESVDKNREWIERTFGLRVADWSPQRRVAGGGKP
jgi:FAD/FMN-containing dehydrogenase/ferredoxin